MVVAIFMLFLILMISLYLGSKKYSFFAFTKSSLPEYPYEGFADYQDMFHNREGVDGDQGSTSRRPSVRDSSVRDSSVRTPSTSYQPSVPITTAYIMTPLTGSAIAATPLTANMSPPQSVEPPTKPAPTKEGFETLTDSKPAKLSGSSYVAEQKPVAFLYNNDANTTCKNYGYTNSKGFICMSSSDIQLLTTRGGNAAGVSDQIGK